jgi:hypothetical protein
MTTVLREAEGDWYDVWVEVGHLSACDKVLANIEVAASGP